MILSENMRLLSNKIDEYLNSIEENSEIAKKAPDGSESDVSLDSMLTSQADASKVAGTINIQKLVQSLGLPGDKAEMFKGAIAALQKNPPQLDSQQASVLLLGFQKMTNTTNVTEADPVQVTKGGDPKLDEILAKHPAALEEFVKTQEFDDEFYMELYTYFLDSGDMPYGVAKARDGDPYTWVADKLHDYLEKYSLDDSLDLNESYNPEFSDKVKFEQVHSAILNAINFDPDCEEVAADLLKALVKLAQTHQINDEVNALFNATLYVIQFTTEGDRTNFLALFHDLDARFQHLNTLSEREFQFVHAELEKLGRALWAQHLENEERVHPATVVPALGTPV